MQESSHTTIDAQGRYHLELPDQGMYLLQVNHDKANYFQPVQPGANEVDIDVFSAAERVDGISVEADVLRIETDVKGETLHIVEHFFIKNDSQPKKTQFSDRAFEFVLLAAAIINSSAALGPGGMPVQASPAPTGERNHYAYAFPIRPGETQFQVTYQLPYETSLRFSPTITLNTDIFIVLLPKTISFTAGPSTSYTAVTAEIKGQAYVSRGVRPSQPMNFTIQGIGQLPKEETNDSTSRTDTVMSESSNSEPQAGRESVPIASGEDDEPLSKYKWWIIGVLSLVSVFAAGIMSSKRPSTAIPKPISSGGISIPQPSDLLTILKDEIFALEEEKLLGSIGEAEYQELKDALDTLLRPMLRPNAAPGHEKFGERTETVSVDVGKGK